MKKINQKGFGGLEVLIIIVVIAIVGGVGFFVFSKNKNESDSKRPSDATSKTSTINDTNKSESTSKELSINELGIKIKVDGDIRGLVYKESAETYSDKALASTVTVGTASLYEGLKACGAADTLEVFHVTRIEGIYNPSEYAATTTQLAKQFPEFAIVVDGLEQGGGQICGDTATEKQLEDVGKQVQDVGAALMDALKKAEQL